jgi:hypothetical protein
MKIVLAAALALLSTGAVAADLSSVRAGFASVSASQIRTGLPSSADQFSALAAQIGGVTMTVRRNLLDVDTIAASVYEADGWQNIRGGIAEARGVSGIVGIAIAD